MSKTIEFPVAWRNGMFYHETMPGADTTHCGLPLAGAHYLGSPKLGSWTFRPCPNCYGRAAGTWITNLEDTAAALGSSEE